MLVEIIYMLTLIWTGYHSENSHSFIGINNEEIYLFINCEANSAEFY